MKFWHILTVCILLSTTCVAQHRWGLAVGPNLSTLRQEDRLKSPDFRIGFNVSGFYNLPISSQVCFEAELGYTLAGAKYSDEPIDMHYLMLPVTITYAPIHWLKIGVGPQGGVLIGSNRFESDFGDYRTIDAGVHASVEFMLKDNLSVQVKNYFGLMYDELDFSKIPIDGDPLIGYDPTYKIDRNNIFQINVRYYFPSY